MKMWAHNLEAVADHNLCSEELAIVFGLLSTPPAESLLITKNTLVCSDCHYTAKFITKLTHRKIVLRDPSCFHHMRDGFCSCVG